MITDLSNTKIKVSSPEESEKVQRRAFELGWGWGSPKIMEVRNLDTKYLYFYEDKGFFRNNSINHFNNSLHKEITLKDLFGEDKHSNGYPKEFNIIASMDEMYMVVQKDNGRIDLISKNTGVNYKDHVSIEKMESFIKDGSWVIEEEKETVCETCNGEGTVMVGKLYPSGHTEVDEDCPDCNGNGMVTKINETKNLSSKNLKEGEIYFAEDGDYRFIFLNRHPHKYICIEKKSFSNYFLAIKDYKYSPATKEQEKWLLHCIKRDKYVSLEDMEKEKITAFPIEGYTEYSDALYEYLKTTREENERFKWYKYKCITWDKDSFWACDSAEMPYYSLEAIESIKEVREFLLNYASENLKVKFEAEKDGNYKTFDGLMKTMCLGDSVECSSLPTDSLTYSSFTDLGLDKLVDNIYSYFSKETVKKTKSGRITGLPRKKEKKAYTDRKEYKYKFKK